MKNGARGLPVEPASWNELPMTTLCFPRVRLVLAALALCLPASAGWALGDVGAPIVSGQAEVTVPDPGLADQIDTLLVARFAALEGLQAAYARRLALQDLSQFAVLTVEGLIAASPSHELRSLMEARLRPILARHQSNISAALAGMGERPSARSNFAPSAAEFPHVANAP